MLYKKNGSKKHKVTVNGFVIYEGKQFAEITNEEYDEVIDYFFEVCYNN